MLYIYGIVPVPAVVAGAGIFGYEVYQVLAGSRDLIAHDAHIGGALFGLAYFLLQNTRRYMRRGII